VIERSQDIKGRRGYRYPLIVKPPRDDASAGIERASVVADRKSLLTRIHYVHTEFEQAALVEQYIAGREIHAAVLGNEKPVVLPLFEMEFEEDEDEEELHPHIISYDAKWDPTSEDFYAMEGRCPARDIDASLQARIEELALAAYRLLGCRDYARVDMRIDEEGNPYILEVNPNPDLADDSAFVLCAKASGRSYSQLLCEVTAMALSRREEGAKEEAPVAAIPSSDHLLRKFTKKAELRQQEAEAEVEEEPQSGEEVTQGGKEEVA
jgi:D-alanine-D-alanine ligase